MSVFGGNIRKNRNEEYICFTDNWIRDKFEDRVKDWFPLKNGKLVVKVEDDKGVDVYDKAIPVSTLPSHFGT